MFLATLLAWIIIICQRDRFEQQLPIGDERPDLPSSGDAAGRGNLAKVGVEGSNPFARSNIFNDLRS